MEKSRSWPSAHDWKSCIPQKGIEGSNPSFSAKNTHPDGWVFFICMIFANSHTLMIEAIMKA